MGLRHSGGAGLREAGLAGAFVRHRGLIAFAAGGAMAEATLLSFLAPSARPLAPQVTALPPLATYHDLRWLFAFNQPWLGFTGVLVLLVIARSAVDAVLIMLAWPRGEHSLPPPRFLTSLVSCAVLTVLVGLVLSPVVTLMFGVALLPFSWPYLAAVPILLGTAVALSLGGVSQAWWRRLPPARTAAWVIATFGVLSLASALMTHLSTPGAVAVAGLAGIVDARAWYGLTAAAVRAAAERPPHPWQWRAALWRVRRALRHRTTWVPMAPLAAVLVLALVVGMARLAFTGTVRFAPGAGKAVAGPVAAEEGLAAPNSGAGGADGPAAASVRGPAGTGGHARGAVLVVEGFGSTCCHSANALRSAEPQMLVRQFSYLGLDAAGQPIPYDLAGNMSIQVLGDRMAAQVEKLYRLSGTPVDIVAESEGTLGLDAMLAQHPDAPVGSVVLLSPIVAPGQYGYKGTGSSLVTKDELNALIWFVGGLSPFGSSGAQTLISSVNNVGARFASAAAEHAPVRMLEVIPLADAVTLPPCPLPRNVVVIPAFHGELLGDPVALRAVRRFLTDRSVTGVPSLRTTAEIMAAAATAWRMPESAGPSPPCTSAPGRPASGHRRAR